MSAKDKREGEQFFNQRTNVLSYLSNVDVQVEGGIFLSNEPQIPQVLYHNDARMSDETKRKEPLWRISRMKRCKDSPTSTWIERVKMPGALEFQIFLSNQEVQVIPEVEDLERFTTAMNKDITLEVKIGHGPYKEDLFLRLMAFYEGDYFPWPVERCEDHAKATHATNNWLPEEIYDHFVRVDEGKARYEKNPCSRRLSVVFPLEKKRKFTMKFMCGTSDLRFKNVALMAKLETQEQGVVGRDIVPLRVYNRVRGDIFITAPKRPAEENDDEKASASKALCMD